MLHDIAPHVYHNEYEPRIPNSTDYVLLYRKNFVLVLDEQSGTNPQSLHTLRYPTFSDVGLTFYADRKYAQFLFSIDNKYYYLASLDAAYNYSLSLRVPQSAWVAAANIHAIQAGSEAFAGLMGWQLWQWYDRTRVCGRCAHELAHSKTERMMQCPHCGEMYYPTINPAVIVAVINDNQVVIERGKGRPLGSRSLIAGFAEAGETIEQTVAREVFEEVGLKVKNLKFYKSQPWPLSSSLLMGFFCELDGPDTITIQEDELDWAGWCDWADLPEDDTNYSLTREMMGVLRSRARESLINSIS